MAQINIADINEQEILSELTAEDLDLILGGGWFKDAYDVLNDAWTDIKSGAVDGFNGN